MAAAEAPTGDARHDVASEEPGKDNLRHGRGDEPTLGGATSRRGLMAAGAAGLAGLAVGAVARAQPASAAAGDNFIIGANNDSGSTQTNLTSTVAATSAGTTLNVENSGTGYAITGFVVSASSTSAGVRGTTAGSGPGVLGDDGGSATGPGVRASTFNPSNGSAALLADTHGLGPAVNAQILKASNPSPAVAAFTVGLGSAVEGSIANPSSVAPALHGIAGGSGPGVHGNSSGGEGVLGVGHTNGVHGIGGATGAGVLAENPSGGVALKVTGKAVFSESGLATVPAGSHMVTVAVPGLTTSSLVLATIHKSAPGVTVESAVPASGSFTIHLNKGAPAGGLPVAWFVLN